MINFLDKISMVLDIKMKFIQVILQSWNDIGINNIKYNNLIDEYNKLVEDNNTVALIIGVEKDFNNYLKNYYNILENLLIYLAYKYFMNALNTENLNVEVNIIIISYVVIKMLLLSRWYKKLNEEDFI